MQSSQGAGWAVPYEVNGVREGALSRGPAWQIDLGLNHRASPLTRINADRFADYFSFRLILERMVQGCRRRFVRESSAPKGAIGIPAKPQHSAILAKERAHGPDESASRLFLDSPPSGAMDEQKSGL